MLLSERVVATDKMERNKKKEKQFTLFTSTGSLVALNVTFQAVKFNPFHATGPFLYPLEKENLCFRNNFKMYRNRSVAWNGLRREKLELLWKIKCDKVFKNGPSKICGRQPLKKFSLSVLEHFAPNTPFKINLKSVEIVFGRSLVTIPIMSLD